MTRTLAAAAALAALCTGCVLAAWSARDARAQDPEVPAAQAEPAPEPVPPRMLCQLFRVDLERDVMVETSDRTSEVGQWVGDREDEGWQLDGIDFEVGQKRTGFPQGYLHVCMTAR